MHCAQGHELVGNEKFCPTCGDPLRKCSNGHELSSTAMSCPECNETLVEGDVEVPFYPSNIAESNVGHLRGMLPIPKSGEVVVMCGKCGFNEIASGEKSGWHCGQCDANWHVITCGKCYEAQVVPEEVDNLACISCDKGLTESLKYSEEATIDEVEPQSATELSRRSLGGVLVNPADRDAISPEAAGDFGDPITSHAVEPIVIETQYERSEFIRIQRRRVRPRISDLAIPVYWIAMIEFFQILWITITACMIIFLFLIQMVSSNFVMPAKTWKSGIGTQEHRTTTFSDDGIEQSSPSLTWKQDWSRYKKSSEDSKYYLLKGSRSVVNFCCRKSSFATPEDEARFRALLRKHTDSSVSLDPSKPYPSTKERVAGFIVFIIASVLIIVFLWPKIPFATPEGGNMTISAYGGQQTFTVAVDGAKGCSWSSSPSIPGFNVALKCDSGRQIQTANLGPNTSGRTKHYSITFVDSSEGVMWRITQPSEPTKGN